MTNESVVEQDPWYDEGIVPELLADRWGMAPYENSYSDLLATHLQALSERLESRRDHLPVLAQRASDSGVKDVSTLADAVPLLFPHQVYKSYPQSFIDKRRWDRLNRWYTTLSVPEHVDVDFSDVSNIDDWVAAMGAAGRSMYVTSGSTGKSGFLPVSDRDMARDDEIAAASASRQLGLSPGAGLPHFMLSAATGPRKLARLGQVLASSFADPDATFFLFEHGESVAEINMLGSVRTASNNGTVRPEDLTAVREIQLTRREELRNGLAEMADRLVERLDSGPVVIKGFWSQLLQFIELLRDRGVAPGSLAPGSIVWGGGGKKSDALPENFVDRVQEFFAGAKFVYVFSMSEILPWFYQCSAQRWHAPAQLLPILLDESGERALEPVAGVGQGRLALYDFSLHDRWGGLITSDWVHADYSRCPCGLASLSLIEIGRITQGADDKLTCAGTMDAYIRDIVAD